RISCGMRATEGAIERVWIDDAAVTLQVIGGGMPIGVCGSGLLDAVAQMRRAGVLEESGRMLTPEKAAARLPDSLARRIVSVDNAEGFVLGHRGKRQVILTQRDVRELQLAKGAIRAGISIMLAEYGIGIEDITEVLLAGAFGSYISPASARDIDLVPQLPIERITAVGNAAGLGSIMALLSTDLREEASRIARTVHYLELSARSDFMDQFMDAMSLNGVAQAVTA
ncbi:MAG TPA: ASKHA domain-containing protein, partial [Chloroflexota bacterium]